MSQKWVISNQSSLFSLSYLNYYYSFPFPSFNLVFRLISVVKSYSIASHSVQMNQTLSPGNYIYQCLISAFLFFLFHSIYSSLSFCDTLHDHFCTQKVNFHLIHSTIDSQIDLFFKFLFKISVYFIHYFILLS